MAGFQAPIETPREEDLGIPASLPSSHTTQVALYCPAALDGHSNPGSQSVHRQRQLCYSRSNARPAIGIHNYSSVGWMCGLGQVLLFLYKEELGMCVLVGGPSNFSYFAKSLRVLRDTCNAASGVGQSRPSGNVCDLLNEGVKDQEKNQRVGTKAFQFLHLPSLEIVRRLFQRSS